MKKNKRGSEITISTKTLIIAILVAVIAVLLFVFLGGYIGGGEVIASPQQASDAITNVSSDIEDLTRTLADIDRSLG